MWDEFKKDGELRLMCWRIDASNYWVMCHSLIFLFGFAGEHWGDDNEAMRQLRCNMGGTLKDDFYLSFMLVVVFILYTNWYDILWFGWWLLLIGLIMFDTRGLFRGLIWMKVIIVIFHVCWILYITWIVEMSSISIGGQDFWCEMLHSKYDTFDEYM